jgi:predicted transcriptional regulator
MSAPKDEVRRLLDELPEEASLEDIQYHIYVRQKIQAGLDDVEAGRILGEEEVERRLVKRLEP